MNDLYTKLTGDLVYNDETITVMVVVAISIIVSLLILIAILKKRKTLLIEVKLHTPKEFREFDPEKYLYEIDFDQFQKIHKMIKPKSKKKILKVTYQRSTPSGNKTYINSVKYNNNFIQSYVEKMIPVFSDGKQRINALNNMYANHLLNQKELNDKIPKIYCYKLIDTPTHRGTLKVGYAKNSVFKRVQDQLKTAARLKVKYEILLIMPAMTITGKTFMDHTVHKALKNNGIINTEGEWFKCDLETVKKAIKDVQMNKK